MVITRPSAMDTNQSGRAAVAKSAPCPASAAPATEPHSATPILTPICLLVDVTAEAAPARSNGMPLTAELVMGAFTIEKPMPNTANTISSCHTGVDAERNVSITEAVVISRPPANREGRPPKRPTSRTGQRREDKGANGDREIDEAGVHRRVTALAL